MTDESTNPPPAGVITDVESAVKHLTQPDVAKEDDAEPEAVQEPQEDGDEPVEIEAEAEGEEPEAEESDDAADDADDEDAEPEDSRYTVKVDGEEFEVTLDELRAGYQKGADYHRKTAALAEEKRQLQAQAQAYEQARGQLAEQLAKFAEQDSTKEPDWVKLANELDPWEYQRQRAEWDQTKAQRAQARQQAQAMQAESHNRILAEQSHKLIESFPEWRKPEVFERDRAEMLSVAKQYGFSEQEFYGAVDHRVFKMLKDAMAGRKLATPKAPPKKNPKPAPKVLKPGSVKSKGERKADDRSALREKLRKNGDVDSAVQFLLGG